MFSSAILTRDVVSARIYFYDCGEGARLVLIHGMFGDFLDREPVLEPLSQSHRVIAVDFPSFGLSSKPRLEYTHEFFVATLQELFIELRLSKALR